MDGHISWTHWQIDRHRMSWKQPFSQRCWGLKIVQSSDQSVPSDGWITMSVSVVPLVTKAPFLMCNTLTLEGHVWHNEKCTCFVNMSHITTQTDKLCVLNEHYMKTHIDRAMVRHVNTSHLDHYNTEWLMPPYDVTSGGWVQLQEVALWEWTTAHVFNILP